MLYVAEPLKGIITLWNYPSDIHISLDPPFGNLQCQDVKTISSMEGNALFSR